MEPFDTLRDLLPGWTIAFTALEGVMGFTDVERRTIWIDVALPRRERRSTIMHEVIHAIRGDRDDDPEIERIVQLHTARHLISVETLARLLTWSTDPEDICDILDVDMGVLRTRLRNLDRYETRLIVRRLQETMDDKPLHPPVDAALLDRWWRRSGDGPLTRSAGCAAQDPPVRAVDPPEVIPLGAMRSMSEIINEMKEHPQWA